MATPKLKTQPCPSCTGTGTLPADDVGPILREEREKAGITRVALAEALNLSQEYLRDLEAGHRRWTNELLASYQKAVEGLRNGN
jgi:ribosome-binding protein aMBF1 (putative translation factor)